MTATAHSETAAVRVDPALLPQIKAYGAFDVDACFNCGNCTAVCPLSEGDATFPRRIIRYAQVGMKEELLAAKELWTCYACGECSRDLPPPGRAIRVHGCLAALCHGLLRPHPHRSLPLSPATAGHDRRGRLRGLPGRLHVRQPRRPRARAARWPSSSGSRRGWSTTWASWPSSSSSSPVSRACSR